MADTDLVDRMAAREFVMVPTLSLYTEPADLDDPFLRMTVSDEELDVLKSPDFVERMRGRWICCADLVDLLSNVGTLQDRGVVIALGTDTGNPYVFPGYSVHLELELLVRAGLSPMEALQAATLRAAQMIGAEDEFGTIESGKRADLLVLGANPLQDIRNTRSLEIVISDGNVVDREALLQTSG